MDFNMFDCMMVDEQFQHSSVKKTENSNDYENSINMERFPEHTPLAMAYVPMQQWGEVYDEEMAFNTGTVFPELKMPFDPEGGCHGQK